MCGNDNECIESKNIFKNRFYPSVLVPLAHRLPGIHTVCLCVCNDWCILYVLQLRACIPWKASDKWMEMEIFCNVIDRRVLGARGPFALTLHSIHHSTRVNSFAAKREYQNRYESSHNVTIRSLRVSIVLLLEIFDRYSSGRAKESFPNGKSSAIVWNNIIFFFVLISLIADVCLIQWQLPNLQIRWKRYGAEKNLVENVFVFECEYTVVEHSAATSTDLFNHDHRLEFLCASEGTGKPHTHTQTRTLAHTYTNMHFCAHELLLSFRGGQKKINLCPCPIYLTPVEIELLRKRTRTTWKWRKCKRLHCICIHFLMFSASLRVCVWESVCWAPVRSTLS